jgi:hypothetical protein
MVIYEAAGILSQLTRGRGSEGMATIAIGDVHGNLRALEDLLYKVLV